MTPNQEVERKIVEAIVRALLDAGLGISIDNGGETFELTNSKNALEIRRHLFLADEDYIHAVKNGQHIGWVYLVYGNDGWDVISDYTVNLESYLKKPLELAEKYSD